jgi:hypothetical protein
MTLRLLHSEFPYILGNFFYECNRAGPHGDSNNQVGRVANPKGSVFELLNPDPFSEYGSRFRC